VTHTRSFAFAVLLAIALPLAASAHGAWLPLLYRSANATTDASARAWLLGVAASAHRATGNSSAEDLLYTRAMEAAEPMAPPALRFGLARWYASEQPHHNPAEARASVDAMMRLAETPGASTEWRIQALAARARLKLAARAAPEAVEDARAAAKLRAENPSTQRGSALATSDLLITLAECEEAAGDRSGAFASMLEARQAAVEAGDPLAEAAVCGRISTFLTVLADHDNALRYAEEGVVLLRNNGADSSLIMDALWRQAMVQVRKGEESVGLLRLHNAIAYALRTGDDALRERAFSTLRSQFLEKGNIAALRALYTVQYPAEMVRAEREDPFLYARLQAFFADYAGDAATAAYWYSKANRIELRGGNARLQRARFQQRYASFLVRQRDYPGAEALLQQAYDSIRADHPPYAEEAAWLQDSVARLQGSYEKAYGYARRALDAHREYESQTRADNLLRLRLSAEEQRRKYETEKAAEELARSHTLQYTGIVLAIIAAFIVILLLRSAHVSPRTLRIVSFLSFVLLFEFIILIADLFFHGLTHGEPWILILIKLVFIAGLSQVHHWLEHKLTHYLSSHEPLHEWRARILSWWKRPTAATQTTTAPAGIVVVEGGEAKREESRAEIL